MDKTDLTENELSLIKFVEEKLDIDRHRLQQRFPFIGNFLMRLETEVGHWEDVPTACTNGKSIYVNALFYYGLTEEERLFVLAHEAFHCVMMHFLRVQNRDKTLWNMATDLEIHFLLTKQKLVAPFVLPHEKNWDGLSAEQIYEELLKTAQSMKISGMSSSKSTKTGEGKSKDGNGSSKSPADSSDDKSDEADDSDDGEATGGSGKESNKQKSPKFDHGLKESKNIKSQGTDSKSGLNEGFDKIIFDGKNPNDNEKFDQDEVENEIAAKLKATIDTIERSRGYIPGAARGILEKFAKREINWKQILGQFVTNCFNGDRKWLPPNRRYVYRGMYLPSMHDQKLKAVVAIDTSGSCVGDLGKFFSELTGLLNSFGKYEITVIQCDAEIQKVEKFDENCNIPNDKKWETAGYGGTSFCPVFKYVDKNLSELDPSCLIYLTDGYGDAPKKSPQYPVLWVLTSDGNEGMCDWGIKTKFRPEKS